MFELFKAECRRFRLWALAAGTLHLGCLLFFDRVIDPLQQPLMVYQAVAAVYAAAGVLLGVFQAATYTRTNHWIALLHRPLAPHHILLGIGGGGATMLLAAVLVPVAILLASHGLGTARFVDARHLLLGLSGGAIALIGFLAGLYLVLAPRRYGWLVLAIALIPALGMAVGWKAVLVQALVIVALALLVRSAFKPDLALPPRRPLPLAGTALAAAFGVYLTLVVVGDLVFQTLWIAAGTHPLNSAPIPGGVAEASTADSATVLDAGLAARNDRQARLWREQIRMSETFALPPTRKALPVRGELTNIAPMEFDDTRRRVRWTFSHDDMRFHGVRLADRRTAGTLASDTPFAAPPLPIDGGLLLAGGTVHRFDEDRGTIRQRIALPAGETIVAPPAPLGEALAVMSDRAIRFYDPRVLEEGDRTRPPFAITALPAPVGSLMRADLIELLDGYLLSLTYARGAVSGPARAWQRIVEVRDGAGARIVAERALRPDFPAASRFAPYWLSPPLQIVRETVETAGSGVMPTEAREPAPIPATVWAVAAALSLAAAAVAAGLARRRRFGLRDGTAWTLATLVLGLPMLIAFWLIRPKPMS